MKSILYFLLAILAQLGLAMAQSGNCYFCNSEVHGDACHDPINPDLIQTQRCSDLETGPSRSYYTEIEDFFKRHNLIAMEADTTVRNTTLWNVCFSLTYEFNSRNVTARGCEQEQKNTNIVILDLCEYYERLTPARITNFNCSICHSNLCNLKTMQGGGGSKQMFSVKLILGILLAKVVF